MKTKALTLVLVLVALTFYLLGSPQAETPPDPVEPHKPKLETIQKWKVGDKNTIEHSERFHGASLFRVINERLNEAWLNDEELIYRFQTSLDTWQFRIANARTAKITPAFDHEKVANGIGVKNAKAIPFTAFKADKKTLYAMTRKGEVYVLNRKTSALSKLDPKTPSPLDLPRLERGRSNRGAGNSRIYFVNLSGHEVELYWVDEGGNTKLYGTIKAGETRDQHSFAAHLWMVKVKGGQELGRYRAEKIVGIARIQKAEAKKKEAPTKQAWRARMDKGRVRVTGPNGANHEAAFVLEKGRRLVGPFLVSPDGDFVMAISRKNGQAHPVTIVESSPRDQVQPKTHTFDYTKPGDRIRHDRVLLFSLKKKKQIPVDNTLFANPWNLSRLEWAEDGKSFSFIYNQRGHQVMRLIRVEASSGKAKTLIEESPKTFVNYSNKTYLYRFPGKEQAIWMSERDGWNHLYWIDTKKGRVKTQATKGSWVVRSVERVDPSLGKIWISAMGVDPKQDPYHLHYGVVDYKRGKVTWQTEGDGTHAISYSPNGDYIFDRYSRVDLAPVFEIRDAKRGKAILELAKADTTELEKTGWNAPVRFSAKGRDGKTDIWGYILFPSWMNSPHQIGAKFPVIESIYAGPHGHHVPKTFSSWRGQRELSELGFIVVKIDGMGTNWRSKAFHDVCWQNIGDGGFPDRIKWMQAAAKKYPQMDLSRVGIYGGSAGGQNAMRAMLAHGDFYKAAAADCGCHDNRMDKIWWNEAWMGWPIGPHYAEQSNVTQAHKLKGALLLTVGEMDRNVDPASTMQVVNALIKADKDFDLIVFPGGGHGSGSSSYGKRRRRDFFVKHLAGN